MWQRFVIILLMSTMCVYCLDYYYYDPTICENVQPGLWVSNGCLGCVRQHIQHIVIGGHTGQETSQSTRWAPFTLK